MGDFNRIFIIQRKAATTIPTFPSYRERIQIMIRGTFKYTNGPYCQILDFFILFKRLSYIDKNALFFQMIIAVLANFAQNC